MPTNAPPTAGEGVVSAPAEAPSVLSFAISPADSISTDILLEVPPGGKYYVFHYIALYRTISYYAQ